MKYTLAAVLVHINKPLEIVELVIPPLKSGQVLVEIEFSGICRSQLMEYRGLRGKDQWLPHLLGHEGSGTVVSISEDVTRFKPGDHVVLGWLKCPGLDVSGAKYTRRDNGGTVNSGPVTTLSTFSVVSESRLTKKPEGMPSDVSVLLGCALPTGAGMVLNQAGLQKHQSLAVVGLGGIGVSALMTAVAKGFDEVIAIDVNEEKLRLAETLGAKHTINASLKDVNVELRKKFPDGVDVSIEAGGSIETIELAFSLIKKTSGKLIFATHPETGRKISIDPHELIAGKQIIGSWGGKSDPVLVNEMIGGLYQDGLMPIDQLLEKKYSLNQVNNALEDLEAGRVLRPIVDMRQRC